MLLQTWGKELFCLCWEQPAPICLPPCHTFRVSTSLGSEWENNTITPDLIWNTFLSNCWVCHHQLSSDMEQIPLLGTTPWEAIQNQSVYRRPKWGPNPILKISAHLLNASVHKCLSPHSLVWYTKLDPQMNVPKIFLVLPMDCPDATYC